MGEIIIPQGYKSALNLHDTQVAIKTVKDYFQHELTHRLHLLRVTAPLFVQPETGLNDNLNGVEHPVSFELKDQGTKKTAEIVQSLAKWKRYALHKYGFSEGEGIYTDMNAIRQDEVTDNIHSVYVDQWDWEKIMSPEERNLDFLKSTVKDIYEALKNTEKHMADQYDYIETILPDEIFFITSQELEDRYPDLTPKEREYTITKEKGAVFIMQIGGVLASGERQDGRSPDYDDWSLNGDLIVYYPVLDIALELSSMGIRVNADALRAQLKILNGDCEGITKEMNALLRRTISYHDYREDFYHAFLAGIFTGAGYMVDSNKEHGEGRSDVVVYDSINARVAIFEAKYTKTLGNLESECETALQQIDDRMYAKEYEDDYDQILCYGISFFKKRCMVKKK